MLQGIGTPSSAPLHSADCPRSSPVEHESAAPYTKHGFLPCFYAAGLRGVCTVTSLATASGLSQAEVLSVCFEFKYEIRYIHRPGCTASVASQFFVLLPTHSRESLVTRVTAHSETKKH